LHPCAPDHCCGVDALAIGKRRATGSIIIVFNRNQDTTGVVQTIKAAVEAYTSYKRDCKLEGDTRLRAVFGRPDDITREIIVTVLVVPIPKAK
jgi:hypothetical protein